MAIDPQIIAIAYAAGAAIFAGSAAMKFVAPSEFQSAVENYRIVPEALAPVVTWIFPAFEIAGAAGLLFPATRIAASAMLIALLAVFTAAIAINLVRGRLEIDCGCFGPMLRQRLSGWLVARNGALAMLLAVAFGSEPARRLGALDYATIVPAAASLVMLYAAANYLLANAPASEALRMRDV